MPTKQPLWADLHNHNEIGYGVGSLERALEIARQRLDVWAFTAHAYWHDIPDDPDSPEVQQHQRGFRRVREAWTDVLQRLRHATGPAFLALPAFEWHSSAWGDRHVLSKEPPAALTGSMTPEELRAFAVERGALLVPHHLAYPPGARGVNWSSVDDTLSPVAELFSEHGSSESDDGAWPMDGHSMSPRSTANTWIKGLERGLRLGAIASTDNHHGCPGAYNEGLAALWTESPTLDGVFTALNERRCYGVSGDRIALDWSLDGAPMGAEVDAPFGQRRTFRCRVRGWDAIDSIDLVRQGRVWRRWTPGVHPLVDTNDSKSTQRYMVRWRWGWGPMSSKEAFHWNGRLQVASGSVIQVMPAFGSVAPEYPSPGLLRSESDERSARVEWSSCTSRAFSQAFDQLAILVEGDPKTEFHVQLTCESDGGKTYKRELSVTLGELAGASREVHMTQPPFTPTFQMVRALPARDCALDIEEALVAEPDEAQTLARLWPRDCMYVRVRQRNGQLAWSSPIWFYGHME